MKKLFRVIPLRKEDTKKAQQAEMILDLYQKGLISQVEMARQLQLSKPAKKLEKENLVRVIEHPSEDAFLVTPYSGKTFEIDALEIQEKNLCVQCLVEKAKLTERKKLEVHCLEDKQKYKISICPIHYSGNPIVKIRLIEKPPKEKDINDYKDNWFTYGEFARRVKFLNGKEILEITPEFIKSLDSMSEDISTIEIAQSVGKYLSDEESRYKYNLTPPMFKDALDALDWHKQSPGKIFLDPIVYQKRLMSMAGLQIENPNAFAGLQGITEYEQKSLAEMLNRDISGSHYEGVIQDDLIEKDDGEKRFFRIWEGIKKKIKDSK